jgi:putative peptidoglycan lipid II flippase
VGGRFTGIDVRLTAVYFALYSIALLFWSAQAIYVRAFYAAGITWLPMAAGAVVTVVAFPLYGIGYRWHGAVGLALASGIGIGVQTITLAVLLHQRRMVSLASLDYAEIGRCLVAGIASGAVVWSVLIWFFGVATHVLGWKLTASRVWDLAVLLAGATLWLVVARWVLERTGSALPRVAMKRLRLS